MALVEGLQEEDAGDVEVRILLRECLQQDDGIVVDGVGSSYVVYEGLVHNLQFDYLQFTI